MRWFGSNNTKLHRKLEKTGHFLCLPQYLQEKENDDHNHNLIYTDDKPVSQLHTDNIHTTAPNL